MSDYNKFLQLDEAVAVANSDWPFRNLERFTEISDEGAEALSMYHGRLVLTGLKRLSEKAAASLSRHKGKIEISVLTELSGPAFELLSRHANIEFSRSTYDLKKISNSEAEVLSQCDGTLELYELTELSETAAHLLGRHQGALLIRLDQLPNAVAESLSKNRGSLHCWNLKEISNLAAKSLSKHKGKLILSGLPTLSYAAARALAEHQGELDLAGLTAIPDDVAMAFSNHQGSLILDGIMELTDGAAEALSKQRGTLSLYALRRLTDAAAAELAKHKGALLLFPLIELSPESSILLKDQRRESNAFYGTEEELDVITRFIPLQTDYPYSEWSYVFRSTAIQDPVAIHVIWRQGSLAPINPPEWLVSMLPAICDGIEVIYGKIVEFEPKYLMGMSIEIQEKRYCSAYIHICDNEAIYWTAHIQADLDSPQSWKKVICYGGNENGCASMLKMLPPGHSMHESKLEALRLWWDEPGAFRAEMDP
jgi:hypothetical protein